MRLHSFVVVRRAAVSPAIAPGWPQVTPLSERPSDDAGPVGSTMICAGAGRAGSFSGQYRRAPSARTRLA